jgi:hypothetical protein
MSIDRSISKQTSAKKEGSVRSEKSSIFITNFKEQSSIDGKIMFYLFIFIQFILNNILNRII